MIEELAKTVELKPRMRLLIPCLVTLSVGALFAAATFKGAHAFQSTLQWIAGLLTLWLAVRLLVKTNEWTRQRDFFAPGVAFIAAYVTWFSLGSANIFDLPDALMAGMFSPIPAAQWFLYTLGIAAYIFGLLLGHAKLQVNPASLRFRNTWDESKFWKLVIIVTAIMTCALSLQVLQFGVPGLSPLAGEERLAIRGIPHFAFISCAFVLLVVIPVHLWSKPTMARNRLRATMLVLITSTALPLLQGGRSDLVVFLLTLFVVFHYLKRRCTVFSLLSVGVTALMGLSLIGYFRDYFLSYSSGRDETGWLQALGAPGWIVPVGYALLYVRYTVATLRDITAIIPGHVPYQHGALTFAALSAPFPGHHETSDIFFKRILGSDFIGGGQPATLLGPLYGDFGAIGIFVGMLMFGLLTAVAYRIMVRKQTLLSLILYAWLVQTAFMSLFGSLFTYINTLSTPVLWIIFDRLATRKDPNIYRR